MRLQSPADVLEELRWAYGETKALFDVAKKSRDTRLMDKAIGQAAGLLDRFAKSYGMFSDGTVVNVNQTTQRLEVAVASLSDDQLRAIIAGEAATTTPLAIAAESAE